jgi:hypothetical protein
VLDPGEFMGHADNSKDLRGSPLMRRTGMSMENTISFGEVLEAVGQLSPDEQETLLDIMRHRLADEGRKRLAQDIREAREEFALGSCCPTTADDLMKEILS